jgi:predicted nucleic acid-binding protein
VSVRKTVDLFIAAWCLEHDAELLHNEEAFMLIAEVVPLRVVQA